MIYVMSQLPDDVPVLDIVPTIFDPSPHDLSIEELKKERRFLQKDMQRFSTMAVALLFDHD